ncbi:MAG: serine/threonine-protein kinase [Kofleriaceae bacterium]
MITRPLAGMSGARVLVVVPAPLRIGGRPTGLIVAGAAASVLGLGLLGLGLIRPRTRKLAAAPWRAATRTPEPRPLPWLSSRPRQMSDPPPELFELDRTAVDTEPPMRVSRSLEWTQPSHRSTGLIGTPFQPTTPTPEGSGSFHPVIRGGTVIGRWEIIRQIGGGGMADVYQAQARGEGGFEKHVAIKVMHPHLARDERTIAHFLDEARLAAGIAHQNVVAIQDLGKIGNDYFIVMEYIDGLDLERLLAAGRAAGRTVPIHIGLGILRRICDGLTAAHQATSADGKPLGIIHRDVKSANVLISRQGAVKVVDFGIAKAAAQLHRTLVGETKGTPAVMAPEQRVGHVVDVRADVYSVGAVGYELLTGQSVNVDFAALAHLGIDNWPHLATHPRCGPRSHPSSTRSCSARWRTIARTGPRTARSSMPSSRP